ADENNIRETLFRYMFHPPTNAPYEKTPYQKKHDVPPLPPPKGYVSPYVVYFLAIGRDKDPDDAFMKRFAGHKPAVKKFSASYVDQKAKDYMMSAVKDKTTQEAGKVFYVGNIKWLARNRVQVRAGYFAGGLNAEDSLYTLVRKGGSWSVVKISATIMS